jgi:trimethylamine--corrinoid protein Co-methyltransferase
MFTVSPLASESASSAGCASSSRLRSTPPRCAKRRIAGPGSSSPRWPAWWTSPWRSSALRIRDAGALGQIGGLGEIAQAQRPFALQQRGQQLRGAVDGLGTGGTLIQNSCSTVPWNLCSMTCRMPRASMFVNSLPRYEILSEDAMAVLDRGWRRLMTEIGIEFLLDESVEVFRAAGQRIEDGNRVHLDPEWVLEQVAKAPREFDVQARNPDQTIHIGGQHMAFASVYGCPFVREGDVRREATMDDFENLVKLSQAFPELDSPGGTICEPNDRPLDSRHLDMVYALQTLSDKPYMGSVTSGPNAADTIRMGEILFGGREAIEATPASISLINVNSPLRYDDRMLSALMEYARAGQALIITPFLLMGAMSPVSIPRRWSSRWPRRWRASPGADDPPRLAGRLRLVPVEHRHAVGLAVVRHARVRSGVVLHGPDRALVRAARGARAAGLNSSQTVDAQAAYESLMTMLPTFLAGANFVMHSAGWLEAGLVSCYEKFIVDIEILRQLRHEFTPLEIDEASLAFGAHEEVGPGGHFLGAMHTLERFRECFYRPLLSSTENFERWQKKGGRDATARAAEIWRATLEAYEQPADGRGRRCRVAGVRGRRRRELGD